MKNIILGKGDNILNFEVIPFKYLWIKYRDAGTHQDILNYYLSISNIKNDSLILDTIVVDNNLLRIKTIAEDTLELATYFETMDSTYLLLADTNKIPLNMDTLIVEGIQNFPVNPEYWHGYYDYLAWVTGVAFDPPKKRYSYWAQDSIPVFIVKGPYEGWRQSIIDSVIIPLNDSVRTPINNYNWLYITNDSSLAGEEGIIYIHDPPGNYTETSRYYLINIFLMKNALIRLSEYLTYPRGIHVAMHELFIHALIDGLHSLEPLTNFSGGASSPQSFEWYTLKVIRNKQKKHLRGYMDVIYPYEKKRKR